MSEMFDVLDETGAVIGRASRAECHGGSFLLHGVVHILIENGRGEILLQKRSMSKDIQPGKWDTSVGGHIDQGETLEEALVREVREELGIEGLVFERLHSYIWQSDVERELVTTFRAVWDGPYKFDPVEIDEVRPFSPREIEERLGTGFFTPNFEEEWRRRNQ